jgi:hypothetical protein
MMHSDKLLELITDQIEIDINTGSTGGLWDMLDLIPREVLLLYLCPRLAQQALDAGLATADEVEVDQ